MLVFEQGVVVVGLETKDVVGELMCVLLINGNVKFSERWSSN